MAVVAHGWQSEAIDGPKGGAGSNKSLLYLFFHYPASELPAYLSIIDPSIYLSTDLSI